MSQAIRLQLSNGIAKESVKNLNFIPVRSGLIRRVAADGVAPSQQLSLKPIKIRFLTRDKGMEIESSKDFQIAVEGQQHTLTINDPYPEDTGVFLISASNNFGKATSTGM